MISHTKRAVLFITVTLSLVIIIIIVKYHKNNERYKYEISSSYVYSLQESGHKSIVVDFSDGNLIIPTIDTKWDTGLLKISLSRELSGTFLEPFIEISCEGTTKRQYFEYGASGDRFVNISFLAGGKDLSGKRLYLKGHHVSIEEQKTTLSVFENLSLEGEQVLVVATHPDDAEIAAFGLYSNTHSHILNITAGDAGKQLYRHFYGDKVKHYRFKGKLRYWDSVTIPMLGNVPSGRIYNLGYFDGTLEKMYQAPLVEVSSVYSDLSNTSYYRLGINDIVDVGEAATWKNLVRDLEFLIKEIGPSVIVAPHPVLDAHPDHQFTTIALLQAVNNLGLDKGRFFFYTNHAVFSELYPFGPSGGLVSLPPYFDTNLEIEKIFSYQLTEDTRIMKVFALEAMHDLRPPPMNIYRLLHYTLLELNNYAWGLDKSYLRRGDKENELFFVFDYDDAARLEKSFLQYMIRK